jgi:predicted rRNA methylase YqxC with S4 and FtsJ domains
VLNFAQLEGFAIFGLIQSPLLGPKGNAEFLVWLGRQGAGADIPTLVEAVISK